MDWFSVRVQLLVQELGTAQFREITVPQSLKTKAHIDSQIQEAFFNQKDYANLTMGQKIEVSFVNKFYWVATPEQIVQWRTEFSRALEPGQDKLRGDQARTIFLPNPRVSQQWIQDLYTIWWLADIDKDNMLNLSEYLLAKFLIYARENGITIPRPLPQSLLDSVTEMGIYENGEDEGDEDMASPHPWAISSRCLLAYKKLFLEHKTMISGAEYVPANAAPAIFSRSGLDAHTLSKVWDLADITRSGKLSETEFCIAMHLVASAMKGIELPATLPTELKNLTLTPRPPLNNSPSMTNLIQQPAPSQELRGSQGRLSRVKEHKRVASEERVSFAMGKLAKSPSGSDHVRDQDIGIPSPASGGAAPVPAKLPSPFLAPPNSFALQPQTPQPLPPQQQAQPASYNPFSQPQQPVDMNKFNFQSSVVAQRQKDIVKDVAMGLVQQHKALHFPPPVRGVSPPASNPEKQVDLQLSGVQRIDDSEIEREVVIGKGTFGSVWKGTMNATKEVVAIKDMPYPSKKEVEMWKKEVQLLSKLVNDNYLVKLKGYCITAKHLTIIMEFMDGGSLYEVIHGKNNPVPWSMLRKVRILRHIAKGIEAIHNKNIVHRDLKSMNILLDSKGTAKLADLGCSRVISEEQRLTLTMGVGSPLWMAPEVHSGSYSFPSDVFSYGVVTFEVFNEKLPDFNPAKRCVVIPDDCIGYPVIKRCTELDPRMRPTSQGLIDMMDTLIATFTTTVARVIRSGYKGDDQLPAENEIDTWYKMFLSYDRDTFDVLLSTGLNALH